MRLFYPLQSLEILLLMKKTFTLQFLPLDLLLSQLGDSILPVLHISAEDALVKRIALVVDQLKCVHSSTLEPMECFIAICALDGSALSLAPEAAELFAVHQVLEGHAYVDPLFALDAEFGVLVHFNTVLVEVEGRADKLATLVFTEWAN